MTFMWRMEEPLWGTRNTVIMNSGLCVIKYFGGIFGRGAYGI